MRQIKLFDPAIGNNEKKVMNKILKSGFWASGSGTGYVQKFEEKFNDYIGSNACVAVNSGTAALHLALHLEDIKNKEVILPSLSFVSTAHAILYNGGKPIFVDVDPETLCLDSEQIVHFGGMACDMSKISKISKDYKLTIIEDAAHAVGTKYLNKKIGKHGKYVCFSFHPVKNLAMPNGGAITINDKKFLSSVNFLKSMRWCGISNRKRTKYDITNLGWNYYMNELSAGIGIEQLKKLDKNNNKRKNIAKRYSKELDVEMKMQFQKNCSYHIFWIQVKNREQFMMKMKQGKIETGIHYLPIHKMSFYKKFSKKLEITEDASTKIVSLPIHPNLSENDVTRVIKSVNKFM
ncbi:MAG: glutamine--scyllo-inositol aminotransferase [Thaumarchaeota archaeon]|nr:MAG: glutamine--scyllo-inositol aminotransferase [Nitrososphaerota archaeon]